MILGNYKKTVACKGFTPVRDLQRVRASPGLKPRDVMPGRPSHRTAGAPYAGWTHSGQCSRSNVNASTFHEMNVPLIGHNPRPESS